MTILIEHPSTEVQTAVEKGRGGVWPLQENDIKPRFPANIP